MVLYLSPLAACICDFAHQRTQSNPKKVSQYVAESSRKNRQSEIHRRHLFSVEASTILLYNKTAIMSIEENIFKKGLTMGRECGIM